ncbi:MAG: SusD/RagB family nutrient-binding outer membrane lipoprotein [Bacteroidota bacterium]|nr:SusD/RagB family nutrient-binding outer membrane lipoprotein [Bacteroidota bacterium]
MKKLMIYSALVAYVLLAGCTKKFDDLNTDPTKASSSSFDPNLLLPTSELNYIGAIQGYGGALLFQSMWAQILADAEYPAYYTNGDKYVASGNILSYNASVWGNAYSGAGNAQEIINLTATKDELSNLRGIALIVKLFNLELITDTYGDVPFSEAVQAKTGFLSPVYDKQQDIYTSLLAKLDSVIPTLDASKAKPTNDIIYGGDIAKWKKFGYTFMLRAAMRLTKVDAATAKLYAEKAFAGGTFAGNDDNAYITFDNSNGYSNGNSGALVVVEDYTQVRWGKGVIDRLKTDADPRLTVIAEVPQPGLANSGNQSLAGDSTFALQQGMPNGYDQNGQATDITNAPGYPGGTGVGNDLNKIGGYSRPTTSLYLALNTPGFLLTYAESELLLAEAAVNGWSVGASAATHYANGLSAALQTYGTLNGTTPIPAATANTYAAAHPLDISTTDNSLQQINTQYWITTGTLFNFEEAWTNWRRSGYPVLTPVNYIGNFTGGTIPRRQIYPVGEAQTNPVNLNAAVSALSGGDNWTSRVWWDK